MQVDASSCIPQKMYNCKEKHILHENHMATFLGLVLFLCVTLLFLFILLLLFRLLFIVCLRVLFVCACVGWFVWVVCSCIMCVLFVCVCMLFSIARTTQDVFPFAIVSVPAHAS